MSKEDRAFREAILAEPDDDVHRLVYADWLTEQDNPRGDFIRAQVLRDKLTDYDPQYYEYLRTEEPLLAKHREEWFDGIAKWARGTEPGTAELSVFQGHRTQYQSIATGPPTGTGGLNQFRRGFVDTVYAKMSDILRGGNALVKKAPVSQFVFSTMGRDVASLATQPFLRFARLLELPWMESSELQILLQSPNLTSVRALQICRHGCRLVPAPALIASSMRNLKRLTLRGTQCDDRSLDLLVQSGFLLGIESLDLSYCRITYDALTRLVRSPVMESLKDLSIHHRSLVDNPELAQFLERPELAGLRRLVMVHPQLGAVHSDRAWPVCNLPPVEELRIEGGNISVEFLKNLFHSPHRTALRKLELYCSHLEEGCGKAVQGAHKLENLFSLCLDGARISQADYHQIIRELAQRLIVHEVGQGQTTGLDLEAFIHGMTDSCLRVLRLHRCSLSTAGIRAMAETTHLSNLYLLSLNTCHFEKDSLKALAASTSLNRLGALDLASNRLSEQDRSNFSCAPFLQNMDLIDTERWLSR